MFSFLSSFEPLSQLIVLENAEPELQRLRCYFLKWCRLIMDSSQISASGNGLKYGMSHTHAHHSTECAVHMSEPMRPVSPCFWLMNRNTHRDSQPFLFHRHHELEVPLGWPSEGARRRAAALGALHHRASRQGHRSSTQRLEDRQASRARPPHPRLPGPQLHDGRRTGEAWGPREATMLPLAFHELTRSPAVSAHARG